MKKESISKEEHTLNALEGVKEKYTAEAAPTEKTNVKPTWLKWAALAACGTLIVFTGIRFLSDEHPSHNPTGLQGSSQSSNPSDLQNSFDDSSYEPTAESSTVNPSGLPMLTIPEDTCESMGYEGCLAYDISDLTNANPWNETLELSSLPVYRSPLSYDTYFLVSGTDFDAMEDFLLKIAARLHMDTETLEINDNAPDAQEQAIITEKLEGKVPEGYFNPTALVAEQNGIKIEVEITMTATITFEPTVTLPEGYHFSHHSSYEDTLAVAEYLQETYPELINMEEPLVNIHGGEYNIYRQQGYDIAFFNAAESLTEQILNYQFFQVAFYCNAEGKLKMARIYSPNLTEKAGDYPIISAEEAEDLLLNGYYITTVPFEMPGQKYIAKRELIYRWGRYDEYYMPYYCFYIELPEEEQDDGLKTYGVYYVPAVRQEYLTNMPVWKGEFN